MAISKQRVPVVQLNTAQTVALPVDFVLNPNGVDLGSIRVANVSNGVINYYCSIVPSGGSMSSGNAVAWNVPIGASGLLSICEPMFLASGDSLMASGSAAGLTQYTSYIRYS